MGSGIPDCSDHRGDIRVFRNCCCGGWNSENPFRDLHHPVPYFTRRRVDAANIGGRAVTLVRSRAQKPGARVILCVFLSRGTP